MTDKKGRLLRDAWHPQLGGTYIIHKDVFFKVLKFYFELFTSIVVRLFIGTQNRLVALHSALFPRLT